MPVLPGESILSQFKNPADRTPITEVGLHFSQIRIYQRGIKTHRAAWKILLSGAPCVIGSRDISTLL